jgi:hypothetical protein
VYRAAERVTQRGHLGWSSRLALLACLAVAAVTPAAASAATGPDSTTQSLADGCQRNPSGLLTFTSPEWVYVNHDPNAELVEGVAHATHTAGGDLPEGHDWYDLNSNITVDSQYSNLLATANLTGDPSAEEYGRLHVEWETGSVPMFVWPTEGDRVKLWGSWSWDCGHWGTSFSTTNPDYLLPGQGESNCAGCPGERTEFHPMQAMVITRSNPYQSTTRTAQTDVYISNQGTRAHAEEQCALENPPTNSDTYPPSWTACVQDPGKRHQTINDRNYSFFVPAPPKPVPGSKLTYRVVDVAHGNGPPEQVQVLSNGIQVTVPFQGFPDNGSPLTYGKSFFVSWRNPSPQAAVHLRAQFQALKVIHSLDPNPNRGTQTGTPPGEYNLYLDLNGYWKFLNDWAPGLGQVLDGQTFTLGQTVDFYVQPGNGVRVFVHGRECDLPKINPCPSTPEVSDDNDLPGDAIDQFSSAAAAIGTHTLTAPSGNYQLTYSIQRAP